MTSTVPPRSNQDSTQTPFLENIHLPMHFRDFKALAAIRLESSTVMQEIYFLNCLDWERDRVAVEFPKATTSKPKFRLAS
jgi:hypothetical protein